MTPAVSIILCTRNRCESLRQTLGLILRLEVPADLPAELLVIDNGSTDQTQKVVAEAKGNMPVRYFSEPRKGKGYAYAMGLAEAKGSIFLFTDDDVHPPANWIEGMCRPIADKRADAVAGGVVFPKEYQADLSRPPYRDHRGWFASTESLDPANPQWMVGANMAFGRHVLADVPPFDVNLGPGALGVGDETLFSFQLIERGYKLITALDIACEHHFDRSRLCRRGMLDMAVSMGRSRAYVDWHWHHQDYPLQPLGGARMWLGLWRRRLLRPFDWIGKQAITEWELARVLAIAFRRQYLIERRKPRKYARAIATTAAASFMAPASA